MAIPMKQLMDEFDELRAAALREQKYEAAEVYTLGETMANNCHGKSPRELIDYLRITVVHIPNNGLDSAEALYAYEDVQCIVDIYEEDFRAARML